MIQRVPTGIAGLDQRIHGGLPRRSVTLLYGPPKSGKSIFAFQFLHATIQRDDACLCVMTDYRREDLATYMATFQWDIQGAIQNGRVSTLHLPPPEETYTVEYLESTVKQLGVMGWLRARVIAPGADE